MKKGKETKVRKSPSRTRVFLTLLGTVVVLAIVAGAVASSRTASAKQSLQNAATSDDNDTTVQFASQKITIDSQTGKLRKPSVEEARALVEKLTSLTDRSTKGLQVESANNGMQKVDLQGRFQTVVLAKPNPDGTNEVRCVSSLKEAAEFLGIDPDKIPVNNK